MLPGSAFIPIEGDNRVKFYVTHKELNAVTQYFGDELPSDADIIQHVMSIR